MALIIWDNLLLQKKLMKIAYRLFKFLSNIFKVIKIIRLKKFFKIISLVYSIKHKYDIPVSHHDFVNRIINNIFLMETMNIKVDTYIDVGSNFIKKK